MVQWEPLMGILPPLNHAQWQETFLIYQQFPEYQQKNFAMTLSEFKSIFWFEYAHRVLGRSIGALFFFPFLVFLLLGKISKALTPKLIALFVLGGLQGLMGWYMVKSGLVNDPHVSQYRLTAHLALAVLIYGYMLWVALDVLYAGIDANIKADNHMLTRLSLIITATIFVAIVSGGFVAGTHAGFAYNTFPLMNGQLIPSGLFKLSPGWLNLFENIATIQFNHRLLAMLLFVFIPALWLFLRNSSQRPSVRSGAHMLLAALALQITLGISTLLFIVPVTLAAAHQAGAILLFSASVFVSHQIRGRTSSKP